MLKFWENKILVFFLLLFCWKECRIALQLPCENFHLKSFRIRKLCAFKVVAKIAIDRWNPCHGKVSGNLKILSCVSRIETTTVLVVSGRWSVINSLHIYDKKKPDYDCCQLMFTFFQTCPIFKLLIYSIIKY